MTTLTGADTYFTNVDSDITQTQWEACIDQAIDLVNACGNLYGITIANMSGTAGSKSWTGTQAEAAWIRAIAVQVYIQDYKSAGATSSSYGVGGISQSQSISSSSSSEGGNAFALAKEAADRLRDLDIMVGPDIST